MAQHTYTTHWDTLAPLLGGTATWSLSTPTFGTTFGEIGGDMRSAVCHPNLVIVLSQRFEYLAHLAPQEGRQGTVWASEPLINTPLTPYVTLDTPQLAMAIG